MRKKYYYRGGMVAGVQGVIETMTTTNEAYTREGVGQKTVLSIIV